MVVSRRTFLSGSAISLTTSLTAVSSFSTPSLALTPEFLANRGDLRIGIMADFPPYVFSRRNIPSTGVLPTLCKKLANEIWLSPSYSIISHQDILNSSFDAIFKKNGGLDILIHVDQFTAKRNGLLYSSSYIDDEIAYIALPDVREIGLFPSTFKERRVMAHPGNLVRNMMKYSVETQDLDIDYNVTNNDVFNRIPLEKLAKGDIDIYVATRRQLEWLNGQSTHKFHINNVFFTNRRAKQKFCLVVNPNSPWLLGKMQKKLIEMRASYQLQRIYQKYDLI